MLRRNIQRFHFRRIMVVKPRTAPLSNNESVSIRSDGFFFWIGNVKSFAKRIFEVTNSDGVFDEHSKEAFAEDVKWEISDVVALRVIFSSCENVRMWIHKFYGSLLADYLFDHEGKPQMILSMQNKHEPKWYGCSLKCDDAAFVKSLLHISRECDSYLTATMSASVMKNLWRNLTRLHIYAADQQ